MKRRLSTSATRLLAAIVITLLALSIASAAPAAKSTATPSSTAIARVPPDPDLCGKYIRQCAMD